MRRSRGDPVVETGSETRACTGSQHRTDNKIRLPWRRKGCIWKKRYFPTANGEVNVCASIIYSLRCDYYWSRIQKKYKFDRWSLRARGQRNCIVINDQWLVHENDLWSIDLCSCRLCSICFVGIFDRTHRLLGRSCLLGVLEEALEEAGALEDPKPIRIPPICPAKRNTTAAIQWQKKNA